MGTSQELTIFPLPPNKVSLSVKEEADRGRNRPAISLSGLEGPSQRLRHWHETEVMRLMTMMTTTTY